MQVGLTPHLLQSVMTCANGDKYEGDWNICSMWSNVLPSKTKELQICLIEGKLIPTKFVKEEEKRKQAEKFFFYLNT